MSVSVGSVDLDGLDELEQVLGGSATDAIDRTIDVVAQADGLPDDAVFSIRDGDDVIGAGVLSGEVSIRVTVARGDVDMDDLLAVLPALVETVSAMFE